MKYIVTTLIAAVFLGCGNDAPKSESAAKEAVQEVKQEVAAPKEVVQKVVQPELTKEVAMTISENPEPTPPKTVAPTPLKTGASLFKTCAGCHGAQGEKAALGKSQIIQGWDAGKTTAALEGYKNGSYGGAMKGVMAGQASKLSSEDIELLANYIATLK